MQKIQQQHKKLSVIERVPSYGNYGKFYICKEFFVEHRNAVFAAMCLEGTDCFHETVILTVMFNIIIINRLMCEPKMIGKSHFENKTIIIDHPEDFA